MCLKTSSGDQVSEIVSNQSFARLQGQMKLLEQDYESIEERMKAEALKDAMKFISSREEERKGIKTRDYDDLLKQFSEYRASTDKVIKELKDKLDQLTSDELQQASENPAREAKFSSKGLTPLLLYGLGESGLKIDYRQVVKKKSSTRVVLKKYKSEPPVDDEALKYYMEENKELKEQLKQAEKDVEIVKWYLKVMEDGGQTKDIVKDYLKLKDLLK